MGPSKSKELIESDFHSTHPSFRNSKVIKDGESLFIESKFATQDKLYDEWRSNLGKGGKDLNDRFLLIPTSINYKHGAGLCGNSGTSTNLYPYYPYLLSEEISNRRKDSKLFKQSDLWYLLYVLVSAKEDLKLQGKIIGDIRSENIFLNDSGKAKVVNLYSWPGQNTVLSAFDENAAIHLVAPQQLKEQVGTSNQIIQIQQNNESEIFSIGATILSAGILDDLSTVYSKNNTFNSFEFEQKRDAWRNQAKYSEIFKSIILNLIEERPQLRLTHDELYGWISNYVKSIEAREPFVIKKAPSKIEQQISVLRSSIRK